ncbi:hypothetical protein QFC21_007159 [Naganishia friedmannii]|uniref:Uncharacterized protein n=1 Tax=Naganishia friedmannii TaxID=89922 RepID=A0ACC2UXZ0_9TREE|nr:hypothetical protein QFC21_007159 [Naganishia friedmannii]
MTLRTRGAGALLENGCKSLPGSARGEEADHFAIPPSTFPFSRFTVASSLSLLCISVSATIYSSGIEQLSNGYGVSIEVATLGVSVYQLGFAFGPLVWGPLSELFGREAVFLATFSIFTLFTLGTALARDISSMLVCRFFAGAFGSSILVISAAIIGDLFDASDRGPAMSFYLVAAFGGPIIGPLSGSFLAAATTYRWIFWLLTIFSGVSFLAGALVPETYSLVRLNRLADKLTKTTGYIHRSAQAPATDVAIATTIRVSLIRPFQMLFQEGIVAFFAVYSGFIYGLLYGFFGAFPWIYHRERGWSTGIASLPFIAVGLGMLVAVGANLYLNKSYIAKTRAHGSQLPPESRLVLCCAGGIALPIGLMIFAFTATPSVHWIGSTVGGALFGFGFVGIFLSMTSYLLDTYAPLYSGSSLGSTACIRSFAGAAFPLFIRQQLAGMTTQWTIFLYACLAVAAAPVPFVLVRYGAHIRSGSKFASKD